MERQCLDKPILLKDGSGNQKLFVIDRYLSRGSSALCYEAYHEGTGNAGVLREFYPSDAISLVRDEAGQLVHENGTSAACEHFQSRLEAYKQPYLDLLKAKQESTEDALLTSFIPTFELYYGIHTVYIWTPESRLYTLADMCAEIQEHPTVEPEHKLVRILYAVEALAKCIRQLHLAGLLHRDIKPGNFGFIRRAEDAIPQAISMFDINTVCSYYDVPDEIMGTEGYIEPELLNCRYGETADFQTDIYAIGAVLFHALVITEQVRAGGQIYKEKYYDELKLLVDESELLRACSGQLHPKLKKMLVQILRKCLCPRTERYECCEDLLEDMEAVLNYAVPSELAARRINGERLVLADMDKAMAKAKDRNAFIAIQYHLYAKPLYQYASREQDTMHILLLGCGKYGQNFLDICLQIGQIPGKKLHVTVISDTREDKNLYLEERPELKDFFCIDSLPEENADSYGVLNFIEHSFSPDSPELIGSFLQRNYPDKHGKPRYVFIALGRNTYNLCAARAVKTFLDAEKIPAVVSFVCENGHLSENEIKDIHPVYVDDPIKRHGLYNDIERMAFNVHMIWKKNLNIAIRNVRNEYRRPYHHGSCVGNVLSLKYKLHSIGIDLEKNSAAEAAEAFIERMKADAETEGQPLKNALICAEHRRWVTEKLCLGYRRIRNLEECAEGITRDEAEKRHVCIVRSRPEQGITDDFDWDTGDITLLDPLDRMSVELHRMYRRNAERIRGENLLQGNNISAIREAAAKEHHTLAAFQEWYICLKDIWNQDKKQAERYEPLKKAFFDRVKQSHVFSESEKKSVYELTTAWERQFYPIYASHKRKNYKSEDVALIEKIPFILTYTESVCLVIPYTVGRDLTEDFCNAAAATVVNPSRIIYLYHCRSVRELKHLSQEKLPALCSYMKRKNLAASLEFVIVHDSVLDVNDGIELERILARVHKGKAHKVKLLQSGEKDFGNVLRNYFLQRFHRSPDCFFEKNKTWISSIMEGNGVFREFPSYRFDSRSMRFTDITGCEMLDFIQMDPHITVADMAALTRSGKCSDNKPEFYEEYRILWDRYCKDKAGWNYMCRRFREHAEAADVLFTFIRGEKRTGSRMHRYIIPFACKKAVSDISDALKDAGIIGNSSCILPYTTDSFEVWIEDISGISAQYGMMLSHMQPLMEPDAVCCSKPDEDTVQILYNGLRAEQVSYDPAESGGYDLIRFLAERGWLIHLYTDRITKTVSFTYATHSIKTLLTAEEKILAVYTYHKARETGVFDDISGNYEMHWKNSRARCTPDYILTKGFSALFVVCGTMDAPDHEFYANLETLAECSGIHATAVLIADAQKATDHAAQQDRYTSPRVFTIWKKHEIEAIGDTLVRIIKGTYRAVD